MLRSSNASINLEKYIVTILLQDNNLKFSILSPQIYDPIAYRVLNSTRQISWPLIERPILADKRHCLLSLTVLQMSAAEKLSGGKWTLVCRIGFTSCDLMRLQFPRPFSMRKRNGLEIRYCDKRRHIYYGIRSSAVDCCEDLWLAL